MTAQVGSLRCAQCRCSAESCQVLLPQQGVSVIHAGEAATGVSHDVGIILILSSQVTACTSSYRPIPVKGTLSGDCWPKQTSSLCSYTLF